MLVYAVKIKILVVVLSFQFNKMCDSGQFPRCRPAEEGGEERPGSLGARTWVCPHVCPSLLVRGGYLLQQVDGGRRHKTQQAVIKGKEVIRDQGISPRC